MLFKLGYMWIIDSISCRAIDNTSIQCLHGKVPVSRINFIKRLSDEAWTALFSKV